MLATWAGFLGTPPVAAKLSIMRANRRQRNTPCKVSAIEDAESSNRSGADQAIGVMRFLQTEWHRHERDRNAWQIERGTMKQRIAKLEGDLRTNKKLRESMDKHIRMLENALRRKNQETKDSSPASAAKAEDRERSKQSPNLSSKLHACTIRIHTDHG